MGPEDRNCLAEQTFPGKLDHLAGICQFVMERASRIGMDERDLFAIQMAVDEAATNIITHGYRKEEEGPIHVSCWREGADFFIQLRDYASPFDPALIPEPNVHTSLQDRKIGGLGMYLMRKLMDRVEFSRQGDENVLTMVRRSSALATPVTTIPVVSPSGWIDAAHAPELERMLREPLEAGQRFLLVDLSQVTHLSSSGLNLLLKAAKELQTRGGQLALCGLHPEMARVLCMIGFADILSLYETREKALKALESRIGSQA